MCYAEPMMIGVIDSASQIYHKKRAFSRKGGDSYGKMPVAHKFRGKNSEKFAQNTDTVAHVLGWYFRVL